MTVAEVINQVKYKDGNVTSLSTGKTYDVKTFIDTIVSKCKFNKKQRQELENYFTDYIKSRSEDSVYIERIMEKYEFKFSDGVYKLKGEVKTIDEIYRMLWNEEKLLPTDADEIIENIEKISEPMNLQFDIFNSIVAKSRKGKSKYLESLDTLYPNIPFRNILYNIIVPKTKPLFHIFYDDGVGGTGKSTLLEVLTMICGENIVSNVLLDQFGNRFIFANMLGMYLNIGDDNGKNDELQNVGTLKSIITGNRVTIDRKNISPIEVRIFAKQLFATNILPYIDFTDGGIMRRLNIVPMNKVIPKDMKLCILDEEEISHIVYEILLSEDLEQGENELAITTNPLYRFYTTQTILTYNNYRNFCTEFGFRPMNVINFETRSKFVDAYIKGLKHRKAELTELSKEEQADMPF